MGKINKSTCIIVVVVLTGSALLSLHLSISPLSACDCYHSSLATSRGQGSKGVGFLLLQLTWHDLWQQVPINYRAS